MKYSVGQCLGEYGFAFYENLHGPIFLVHKVGTITKMNKAARKFLNIAHFGCRDLESAMRSTFSENFKNRPTSFRWRIPDFNLKLVVQRLEDSDFFLVEVMR